MNDKEKDKREVILFYSEASLKADFYKLASEKNVSPSSILRALMRRTVNAWEEEKQNKNKDSK